MKHLISTAILAIALGLPIGAIAGEPLAHGPMFLAPQEAQNLHLTSAQQQALSQVWSTAGTRLQQLHSQTRNQILGVLTPNQRTVLAQVVGNLAISANPDEDAAALQIQNSLSPTQSQRILSLHASLRQQAMSIMEAAHSQAQSLLTAQQRQQIQQDMSAHLGHEGPSGPMGMHGMEGPMAARGMNRMYGENPATEAGHILLSMALHGGGMQMEYRVKVHAP